MTIKKIVSFLLVACIAGGVGFFGGKQYATIKNPVSSLANQDGRGGNFRGGPGGPRQGERSSGGFTMGDILSKDEKSITIKMRDGGSKIIFLSETTTASKPTIISLTELTIGESIVITGKTNNDGSITAASIQVRPPMLNQDQTTTPPTPKK